VERLARALAGAFLAGRWTERALTDRGRTVTGPGQRWLRPVVRDVLRAYPSAPADRPRELAALIGASPFLVGPLPAPRRWYVAPTRMGPGPGPAIDTVAALATFLGLTAGELDWYADVRGLQRRSPGIRLQHYRRRWLDRPGGGVRLLEVPRPRLRELQRRILDELLAALPVSPWAYGFVPGRSAAAGAARHVGSAVVVSLDLAAFFASVTAPRVYGLFRSAGYPEPVAWRLAGLTTVATPVAVLAGAPAGLRPALAAAHLPQGAPSSPALANLAAGRLDRRLAGLAAAAGATYTRYADDLTFSGEATLGAGRMIDAAGRIVAAEGFRLQPAKTRVQRAGGRQTVTGIVVNARPNVRREEYDALRALLHNAARHGPASQNRAGHPDFRAHLAGRIAWVAAVNPGRGDRLRAAFDRIVW
jgi:RNA-directed DNA polymerase